MNWFKRLCMFVFGLSGLLALAALCLTWVGPWTTQARSMLELSWYFIALEVLVCIAAVGLLANLLVALFHPRNPKETIVADVSGGTITVTRAAIVSQAKHIVEADGTCTASTVRVRMRKRGHIRVNLRVTPHRPIDVVQRGEVLYAALNEGLAHVCGSSVKSISLVFNEPEQQGSLATHVETGASDLFESEPEATQDSSQAITVSMSGHNSLPTAVEGAEDLFAPEPESAPTNEISTFEETTDAFGSADTAELAAVGDASETAELLEATEEA